MNTIKAVLKSIFGITSLEILKMTIFAPTILSVHAAIAPNPLTVHNKLNIWVK